MKDRIVTRSVRRSISIGCTLALMLGWMGWTASSASATVFSNAAAITVPATGTMGVAAPYPSGISVPAPGKVADVNVTVTGISHTYPKDIALLLVGPGGQNVQLETNAGGSFDLVNVTLKFDDAAATLLPNGSQIVSGTYKPTALAPAVVYGAPAPAAPYGTTLSVFNGSSAAGTWNLFVVDAYTDDIGSISGGWSLDITYLPEITSFTPGVGEVGDAVTVTGLALSGATAMKFGTTPVATFTVDSDTQITATVPAGAGTGPITVIIPATIGHPAATLVTSAFVVNHERNVSLTLSGKKAIGTVNVKDGFSACGASVPVNVQHLEHGKWKTKAGVLTKADGSYKAVGLDDPGKYRTVAKKTTLSSGDVCLKDISPVDKK
jgi:subtilisin-like proprotein convertase family protein